MESVLLDEFLCWVQVHMKLPHLLAEDLALDFLGEVGHIENIEGKKTSFFQHGKARAYTRV